MSAALRCTALVMLVAALFCGPAARAGERLRLAADGVAAVEIVVAHAADATEKTAAEELAAWLEIVTGAPFAIVEEGAEGPGAALYVGSTVAAAEAGVDVTAMGREAWVRRPARDGLVLAGGRPRGTLYAVYEFLEDEAGVRWWTPYDDDAPFRPDLRVRMRARSGEPAFGYRDVRGHDGPLVFNARSRFNGHLAKLPPNWGGTEGYGPPRHVHNLFRYVPPETYFDDHPEYFAERAGLRTVTGQLCLTNSGLRALMLRRLRDYIDEGTAAARAAGAEPPRVYAISQEDRGGACECDACRRAVKQNGNQSGVLIEFLNELAAGIAETHPDILIDTLAYHYTLRPPGIDADSRIVVRLSGLQRRNFLRPVRHEDNAPILAAIEAWRTRVSQLRIWDYTVVWHGAGEFPLPNVEVLADDLRLYRDLGIDGLFVQHEFPIAGDMRDLKLWVLARLLVDPDRDVGALVREFTDGYYGPGGRHIRGALRLIRRAARDRSMRVGYRPDVEDYAYLTPRVLAAAHRRFDRAETAVAGDTARLERVRHARLTLDRATLVLHGRDAGVSFFDRAALVERYRATWAAEIDRRLGADWAPWALEEVEREVRYWTEEAAPRGL